MVSPQQALTFDTTSQTLHWELPRSLASTSEPDAYITVEQNPSSQDIDNTPSETPTGVSVSPAFYHGAHGLDADLVLCSSDSVLFYVHSSVLSTTSKYAFQSIILAPMSHSNQQYSMLVAYVPETSIVLNIIIHALYSMSSAQYSPPFTALAEAIDQMPRYEIDPKHCIVPSNPLRAQLLSHASTNPLELYALAARHDIYDVAAQASSHLISYPPHMVSDELAIQMGAVYLKRLLCLHVDRMNALRSIVLVAPLPHYPTPQCDLDAQQSLTRAWAVAVSNLVEDARPDLSAAFMKSVFAPAQNQLSCPFCRENFSDRVEDVILQWSSVKCTI